MFGAVEGAATLEIVEGPRAGRRLTLERAVVIGRAPDSDLVLEDPQASRRHARIAPASDGSAVVEDLGSSNGTFVNNHELTGSARLDPGDDLLVGVTVIQLRSPEQMVARPSAVRRVPPALATAPSPPQYVDPGAVSAELGHDGRSPGTPQLDKYLDVRVRRRAQLAPLALFVLVALALIIYFAAR
jgi:predicted component of type VI protein secretion system